MMHETNSAAVAVPCECRGFLSTQTSTQPPNQSTRLYPEPMEETAAAKRNISAAAAAHPQYCSNNSRPDACAFRRQMFRYGCILVFRFFPFELYWGEATTHNTHYAFSAKYLVLKLLWTQDSIKERLPANEPRYKWKLHESSNIIDDNLNH